MILSVTTMLFYIASQAHQSACPPRRPTHLPNPPASSCKSRVLKIMPHVAHLIVMCLCL